MDSKKVSNFSERLSKYQQMVLHVDDVGVRYLIFAGGFSWLLLAGFLISPSVLAMKPVQSSIEGSIGMVWPMKMNANWGILSIACLSYGVSIGGIGWVWHKCKGNYVWTVRYLIM